MERCHSTGGRRRQSQGHCSRASFSLKEGSMDVGAAQEAVKRFCLGLCSLIKNWQRDHPSVSDRDIPILSEAHRRSMG